MKIDFSDLNFVIEATNDGSPTLRIAGVGESMHHSGGAASETQYIYKSVIDQAYQVRSCLKTCVVGLGLGYIEISWALNPNSKAGELTSFEKVEGLSQMFAEWLSSSDDGVYDQIALAMGAKDASGIKKLKAKLFENYKIQKIEKDLQYPQRDEKWNLICYDAFSSKTNQELWREEFLDRFIKKHAEEDCVLTTYACTGILKRVLAQNDFKVIKRLGFQGKRDATLALRGIFKDSFQLS